MYGKEGFWKGKKIPKEIVKKSLDNRRSYDKEQNPNWKGGVSYVYCECGKRIGYGHTHCNKCRPRSENNNPFFGKKHTQSTKLKLNKINAKSVITTPDGIFYGIREVARKYNINRITAKKWTEKKEGWSIENISTRT
jgi:hypothetical protein